MAMFLQTSDAALLDLLRICGPVSVRELAGKTGVTATAVRQRLNRMMGSGLVERWAERNGRGRPSHKYTLTQRGHRSAGTNYGDLAVALWQEVRAIRDPEVRRGLLQRIASTLARTYAASVRGRSVSERMESLGKLFSDRQVPMKVNAAGELPVLTALACPYPDLAELDRAVCAMERMLFSEVLGAGLKLTECRLDGARCCTFEVN